MSVVWTERISCCICLLWNYFDLDPRVDRVRTRQSLWLDEDGRRRYRLETLNLDVLASLGELMTDTGLGWTEYGLLNLRMWMWTQFDDDGQRQEVGQDEYIGLMSLTIRQLAAVVVVVSVGAAVFDYADESDTSLVSEPREEMADSRTAV